jgi:hypothetical protein
MTRLRDRPSWRLTRHFFTGMFDLGFLSETGAESFKRMVVGVCAVFFSFGLLVARVLGATYASLAVRDTPERYGQALLAGHAFLIAVPMWIVAFVSILVGHALFPDETDFRVLMALPLSQRAIFGAKLLALTLFTGLFILGAHAAMAPLFLLMSMGSPFGEPFLLRTFAYGTASILGSGFVALAVAATHGLLVIWAPRGQLLAASAALRSVMLCVVVLALPFVFRLPTQAVAFARDSAWLYLAPPVWFLGIERLLLGDSHAQIGRLAQTAALAAAFAAVVSVGSYAALYRRFDRVILRPAEGPARMRRRWTSHLETWRPVPRPVFVAIRAFTVTTLRRSVLHQGIVVVLSAAAAGLVANSLLAGDLAGWLAAGGVPRARLIGSVIWAPFALMFAVSLAVRAALLVPIEQRANWVFRVTESDALRPDLLGAGTHTVFLLGVIAPVAAVFPLQCLVLGPDAIAATVATIICGWVFVEILMKDGGRIPSTCSYIPGKGFVPLTILKGFVSFVLFTTPGAALAQAGTADPLRASVPIGIAACAALVLRRRRLGRWSRTPLEFEDELPAEVNPLRLSQ